MIYFICFHNLDRWTIIKNNPYVFYKTIEERQVPKEHEELEEAKKKKVMLNYKAITILHCALNVEEFNRVCICNSAKKIWDQLKVIYEGNN